MANELIDIDWDEVMNKFSSYEGSVVNFCKENHIKRYQFYNQRRRLKKKDNEVLYAIPVKKKKVSERICIKNLAKVSKDIRIEVDNVTVYIH
ncbi:IS66 family insertion sequence element accessory protein TnpA [Clostridium algidicarnis]|uniref:IS66 family insertion sequence element accessory protein TnpA n=1 Tax=Clostridium algidicarnis TaxID=37659 RepID=UPI001C0E18DD|nr:hypothetical protein [Clostridium algidicarnis]MBU3203964.1 hypothetical protein [Clostridium algidicarnis]MBU3212118.1 hypothetical protein [Clostridium algidicarnis]MBU3221377.1 hypothetical protein [Clostridium algidicarnis]